VSRPRHPRARGAGGVRRREEGGRLPPRGPDRLPQTTLGPQGRPAWPPARRWRSGAWPGDLPTPGHGHPPRGPVADPAGVRPGSRRGWRRREGMAAGGRDTAPDRPAAAGRWQGRGAPHRASRTRRRSGASARGWTGRAPGRRPRARGHASLKRTGQWHAPWRRPAVTRGGGLAARRRQRASTGNIVCGLRHRSGLPPAQLRSRSALRARSQSLDVVGVGHLPRAKGADSASIARA
jgi:hypothetical protein